MATVADQGEVDKYLITQTKKLRTEVHRIYEYIRSHMLSKNAAASRSYAIAITKLEEAKMWMGKALGDLGNEIPEEFKDEPK